MGYEVNEATLDAYAQHILKALVDEKEEKFGTTQEKGLKFHQEQKVKILEARRKEEQKQKRKEEREAKKEAQATPNVFPVTTEPSKQLEGPFNEPFSPKQKESVKRKQKMARQYMTISSEEEIWQAPKKKGVFSRVVREKKEEQKNEQNPPEENVHDVETEVEKDKGSDDKVYEEAPKHSEAPSGKATGAHEDVEINIPVEDNPPPVIDVDIIEVHEVEAAEITAPSGEATGPEEKVKDAIDQKTKEKAQKLRKEGSEDKQVIE
ncbi:uncharacterized protein LOC131858306 [Cryptomeria japonica]|uniref:uncharacterized protein LOC131858306 n=1 Tax=Cryptomeria japonica TaxID=3369 RepID=UPI0027DA3D6B|nr:uncharacterized protein LOC131858306 [Cryptomeria japonica]